jgi:hypothetical protein
VQTARDPDSLATKQQSDADALAEETEREIRKHPEKKEEKETLLAAGQKDAAEMIEFLNARTLRSTTLNSGRPDVGGWVLFSTKSNLDRRLAEAGGNCVAGALRKPDRRVPVLAPAQ